MTILRVSPTFANIATWVRSAAHAINSLIGGKQDLNENLTSIAGLDLTGHSGDAIVVVVGEDGFELAAGAGGGGTTDELLTFNNGGAGAASGATFDGSAPITVSHNTVGAAASTHTHAQADVTNLVSDLAAKQPLDGDLTALAALSGTNTIYYRSAADTWTAVALSNDLLFSGGTLGINRGTGFPGSPASGDRFLRTDRNIRYFYDGTRWLSEQMFSVHTTDTGVAQTVSYDLAFNHPFIQKGFSIYIETFQVMMRLTNGTTASNYFVAQLNTLENSPSATTALGSGLSSQGATTNAFVNYSETINAVVPSTEDLIFVRSTETGTASMRMAASFTYRLIG